MHLQIQLEPEGKVHLYIELKPAVQGKLRAFMSSFEPFVIAPGCVAIALVCFFRYLVVDSWIDATSRSLVVCKWNGAASFVVASKSEQGDFLSRYNLQQSDESWEIIAIYLSNSCFRQSAAKLRLCFDVYFQQIETGECLRKGKAASKAVEGLCDEGCTKSADTNLWQRIWDNRLSAAIAENSSGKSDFLAFHVLYCVLLWMVLHKNNLRFGCVTIKANVSNYSKSNLFC